MTVCTYSRHQFRGPNRSQPPLPGFAEGLWILARLISDWYQIDIRLISDWYQIDIRWLHHLNSIKLLVTRDSRAHQLVCPDPLPNSRSTLPRTGRTVLVYKGQGVQFCGIGVPFIPSTCWIFCSTLRIWTSCMSLRTKHYTEIIPMYCMCTSLSI